MSLSLGKLHPNRSWCALGLAGLAVPVVAGWSSTSLREINRIPVVELAKDRIAARRILGEDLSISPDGRMMLIAFSVAPRTRAIPGKFLSADTQKFVIAVDHRERTLEAMCERRGVPSMMPFLSALNNELTFINNENAIFGSLDEIGAISVRGENQCRSVAPQLTGKFPGKRRVVQAVAASERADFFSVAIQEFPEGKDMPRGWFAISHPRLLRFNKLSGELEGDCELPVHVSVLSASTDGRLIAVGDRFWSTQGDVSVAIVESQSCRTISAVRLLGVVGDIHFFPDGKAFAATTMSSGQEAAVRIFDTGTGKEIKKLHYARRASSKHNPLYRFAISPSGKWLAITAGHDVPADRDEPQIVNGGIQLWDVTSGEMKAEVKLSPWPVQVRFFSDDKRFAVLTRDLVVRFFEIAAAP